MDFVFKINNIDTIGPTDINFDIQNILSKNSMRSEISGRYIYKMLKKGVKNMSISWDGLKDTEGTELIKNLQENDSVMFEFFNPLSGLVECFSYVVTSISLNSFSFVSGTYYFSILANVEEI